jgi:hypothetical protein
LQYAINSGDSNITISFPIKLDDKIDGRNKRICILKKK